jgi:hypothetical protein
MFGEATPDVSGTFAGEAIRVLILFAAQHPRGKAAFRISARSGVIAR